MKKVFFVLSTFLILCAGMTYMSYKSISFDPEYKVEAKILLITYDYDSDDEVAYVLYTYKGEKHNALLEGDIPSSYYEGKIITVYVDPDDYSVVRSKTQTTESYITGMVLLLFFGGLFGFFAYRLNAKDKRISRLRMSGSTIVADYEGTRMNLTYSVNGKHPYNVYCSWTNPDNNFKYTFKSENVWTDISHEIEGRHIDKFRVFVNPNNFNEYIVDIDNIKNVLIK
jgi:hypothetical protein